MQKIKEDIVYDGKRKISKAIFKTYDNKLLEYELRIGKTNTNVLAITKEGKFILVKQFRVGPNQITIDLPGGGVDEGESPKQAISRELLEETGYKGKVKFLNKTYLDAYSTSIQYNYIATNCIKVGEKVSQYWDVELYTLEQLLNILRDGKVINSTSAYLGLFELKYIAKV